MKKFDTQCLYPIAMLVLALIAANTRTATAAVNPALPFYGGGGAIIADPAYPIVGENTHIQVTISNTGDQPATNVRVKVSFNDWGVTFNGWQEIDTVTIPSIPAGGTALAEVDHVFVTRTHTCLEALIVGADQDDDPNDDRGQINLEVVNAGETFSYNVPVRNEGDAPLNLLVAAHCKDAAGQPAFRCKDVAEQVQVPPGEEVLVPIQLDLRGVPVGQEIVLIVDAYDLGAANPFAAANHNHVELRIVRSTAMQLKNKALAVLNATAGQVSNKTLKNRIEAAGRHVQKALSPEFWVDPNRVRAHGGSQVFAQEQAATEDLAHLLRADLPVVVKSALDRAALLLADADRILAQTAASDAGDPLAAALVDRADASRIGGDYPQAVKAYHQAWQEAVH